MRQKCRPKADLYSHRASGNRRCWWWNASVKPCFGVFGFVVICCRIAYVGSKVAVAIAIVVTLVFGQALHQHYHVQNAVAVAKGTITSSGCLCQSCPFHSRDASNHDASDHDAPHDEHNCGVCQVLLQSADPPPAIIFGDCFAPKPEVLTISSDDCEWISLPPQSARGPPA